MKAADIPTRFPISFGASAGASFVRDIPEASQIGINNGRASLETGFPPLCFLPVGAGGVPPDGRDFNGILRQATAWSRWQGAGGPIPFDPTFSTAVGGYPLGAIVASRVQLGKFWYNLGDDNTTDPDSVDRGGWVLPFRNKLVFDQTFYVNLDTGDDRNGGLAPSTAFQTIGGAWFALQSQYDFSAHTAQIVVAASSSDYPRALLFGGAPGQSSNIAIVGDAAVPGNCKSLGFALDGGARVSLAGFKLQSSSLDQISVPDGCELRVVGNCDFGATVKGHINGDGGRVYLDAAYTVSGGAQYHLAMTNQGKLALSSVVLTISGTPAFSEAFAIARGMSLIKNNGGSFSGPATGKRYDVAGLSFMDTLGGPNFFPGDVAGTAGTGGLYV